MSERNGRPRPPRAARAQLSNGLTVIYLETENEPISACHLFVPGGVSEEENRHAGLTMLRWSLLLKGSERRSARELAEDIESLGASLGAGATHDYSEVSCHSTSENFLKTLEIMGEVIFHPVFSNDEVAKEKTALMAAIRAKKESIFSVAGEELNGQLFAKHPYGRPSSGTEESVQRIHAHDVLRWHKKILVPNKAVLAAASNIPFARLLPHLRRLFGDAAWKKIKEPPYEVPPIPPVEHPQIIRRTERFEQAFLLIGFPTPSIGSKDYATLKLLNAILGGGMSARLFQELREKEGLAYDIGSYYPTKQKGSAFVIYMGLQFSRLVEAKKRIEKVLDEIRRKKLSALELSEIRNFVKGTYILDHQTNSQRAHYLGFWEMLGMKASYDKKYIREVDAVTAAMVRKAAKKYFGRPSITVEIHPQKSASQQPVMSVR